MKPLHLDNLLSEVTGRKIRGRFGVNNLFRSPKGRARANILAADADSQLRRRINAKKGARNRAAAEEEQSELQVSHKSIHLIYPVMSEVTARAILANQGARDKKGRKRAKKLAARAADPQRRELIKSKTYLRDRVKEGEYDPEKYSSVDQGTARSRQSIRNSIQSIIKSKRDTKAAIANLRSAANPTPPKKPSKRMRWRQRKMDAQGTQTSTQQSNEDNDT